MGVSMQAGIDGEPRPQRGFTLLELLVVLVLVGLVTAIAVPNLERLYGAVTRGTERAYILDQFVGLGQRAMRQGRNYVVFDAVGPRDSDLAGPAGAGDSAIAELLRERAEEGAEGAAQDFAALLHSGYELYVIDLPEGWEIQLDPPLVIRANGVCLGAGLTLYYRREAEPPIELEPPWCRIEPGA